MEALETTDDVNISSFARRVHKLGSLKVFARWVQEI